MTKKSSPRNKEWEKDRRDRLNQTFDKLAALLPQYDPSSPFSKVEILQKSIGFIEELEGKLKDLLADKDKAMLEKYEEFKENLKLLRERNSQLVELLKKAGITVPNFKALLKSKNVSENRIENLLEEDNVSKELNPKTEKPKKYSKKLKENEVNELNPDNQPRIKRKYTKRQKKDESIPETDKNIDEIPKEPDKPELNEENHEIADKSLETPLNQAIEKKNKTSKLIKLKVTGKRKKYLMKKTFYNKIKSQILKKRLKSVEKRKVRLVKDNKIKNLLLNSGFKPINEEIIDENKDKPVDRDLSKSLVDLNEILPNPLSHPDLSSDIFASLQVPPGVTSPTVAFLMSFPVVSSISAGKNPEHLNGNENQNGDPKDPEMEDLNLFNNKDDFSNVLKNSRPKIYSENNNGKVFPMEKELPQSSKNLNVNEMEGSPCVNVFNSDSNRNKISNPVSQSCSTNYNAAALFSESNITCLDTQPFTFCLTTSTNSKPITSHNSISLIPESNEPIVSSSFHLSTATKTTTTFANGKQYGQNPGNDHNSLNFSCDFYGNNNTSTEFTFSLTKTTSTVSGPTTGNSNKPPATTNYSLPSFTSQQNLFGLNTTAISSTSSFSEIETTYTPFSFTTNSFIPPPPPPCLPSHNILKPNNACEPNFSFSLTPEKTNSKSVRKENYNLNTLNPFSIETSLPSCSSSLCQNPEFSYNKPLSIGEPQLKSSKIEDKTKPKAKSEVKFHQNPIVSNKENSESKKYQVNWMATSQNVQNPVHTDFNPVLPFPNSDFCQNNLQNSFPYVPPPIVSGVTTSNQYQGSSYKVANNIQYESSKKSDIFFAHPPEDHFSWSSSKNVGNYPIIQPKSSGVHNEFSLPPLLPHPPPILNPPLTQYSQLNTKSKTIQDKKNHLSSSGQGYDSCFSVSNLVDSSKTCSKPQKASKSSSNNSKWKTNLKLDENNSKKNQISFESPSSQQPYSAESLINNTSCSAYNNSLKTSTRDQSHPNFNQQINHFNNGLQLQFPNNLSSIQTEPEYYDFSLNPGPSNHKIDQKQAIMHQQDLPQNYFPPKNGFDFQMTNDFCQPPIIPPISMNPPVEDPHLGSKNHPNGHSQKQKKASKSNPSSGPSIDFYSGRSIRPIHHQFGNYEPNFNTEAQPNPPPVTSNYFPVPIGMNNVDLSDPHPIQNFSYQNQYKSSQCFENSNNQNIGTTTNYNSGNSLTNFNLSSICPEINNTPTEKNSQW